jgi:hypothetical protein
MIEASRWMPANSPHDNEEAGVATTTCMRSARAVLAPRGSRVEWTLVMDEAVPSARGDPHMVDVPE